MQLREKRWPTPSSLVCCEGYKNMRAPFQVLIIPFRRGANGYEFAVLRRSDTGWWQFVAGGGEDDETPVQAAQREISEETGLADRGLMKPDSCNTVPKDAFADAEAWGPDIYVVPEYCFAVDAGDNELVLSSEHTGLRWVSYDEASRLLKWDSNRNALWELRERLKAVGEGNGT